LQKAGDAVASDMKHNNQGGWLQVARGGLHANLKLGESVVKVYASSLFSWQSIVDHKFRPDVRCAFRFEPSLASACDSGEHPDSGSAAEGQKRDARRGHSKELGRLSRYGYY